MELNEVGGHEVVEELHLVVGVGGAFVETAEGDFGCDRGEGEG